MQSQPSRTPAGSDAPTPAGNDEGLRQPQRLTLPGLATIVAVVAVLFLARDVFLPLAIAMLLTFALSPAVTALRRRGWPHLITVLVVVAVAFALIAVFLLIVGSQLALLAQNLPTFQGNILTKLESLQQAGGGNSVVARVSRMMAAINAEIGSATSGSVAAGSATSGGLTPAPGPMPVEVVTRQTTVEMLQNLVLPLLSPIATTGLVVVVVIFMLLEREDLRDRFIRLVGSNDLHRTTQVLEEAGQRVAQYLLIQLLINVIYALPIGIGLWLIGVPNAALWGMLTLVLRFIPYIGAVLSAAFPLFLAFAVSPDWSAVLWTLGLFAGVELLTSNVIEPWLYGSRTGVSALAIIIAAIFWTWIWGPLGLVLSTPLTVCLVVLGRHIPQFELFDILFGDEPVLAPHARLYQRLLAGDGIEAIHRAGEALEEQFLADYFQETALPALLLAQDDAGRGVLTPAQQERISGAAMDMLADLEAVAAEEREALEAEGAADLPADAPLSDAPPADAPRRIAPPVRVLCVGGRSSLDDVSAAMLAQALVAEGVTAAHRPHGDLAPQRLAALDAGGQDCLILAFLDPRPSRASLLHVRRLKLAAPALRVGVVIWQMPDLLAQSNDPAHRLPQVSPERLAEAAAIGADFVVTGMDAALEAAVRTDRPKALPAVAKRRNGQTDGRKATRRTGKDLVAEEGFEPPTRGL